MKRVDNNDANDKRNGRPTARSPAPRPAALRPLPEDRVEFERELMRKLGLLRREIEGLRRRLRSTERSKRAEYTDVLDALEIRGDRLERQLERLVTTPEGSWEANRVEAVETWRKLKRHLIRVALAVHQQHTKAGSDEGAKRPSR